RHCGVAVYGTMAHSFVQAHDDEAEAFAHFAADDPEHAVLLLDTYDTEAAAAKVVALAREGVAVRGVRLDSGDLAEHARRVRRILDAGGLREVTIFASGNLDEDALRDLVASGAPIDGFGLGTPARRGGARAASRSAPPPRARRRLPGDRRAGAPRPGRGPGRAVSFRLTAPGDDWLAAVPPLAALDRGPMPARVGNVGFGTASWTDRSLLASRAFYPPAASTPERRLRYYARHFPVVEVDATYYALP